MKRDYRGTPFICMTAIGDSIIKGAMASREEFKWVNRLAQYVSQCQGSRLKVVNAGIDGNLISKRSRGYYHEDSGKPSALERYREDVIQHNPDLVLIAYGINDARCGTPIEDFIEDMDMMIGDIKKRTLGIIIIVSTYFMTGFKMHGDVWGHADINNIHLYNDRLKECARENDLLYVDVFNAFGMAEWAVHEDGVHPNDLGNLLIANKVFETIAVNCSCISSK